MATLAEVQPSHYDNIVPNSTSASQLALPYILFTAFHSMSPTRVDHVAHAIPTLINRLPT